MIRKAEGRDIEPISAIYEALHDLEEAGQGCTCWVRGVYPTRETAENSVNKGEMYVWEEDGRILAAARINQEQDECYFRAHWNIDAPEDQIMVLHTLVVDPTAKGKGIGTGFVDFYERHARENGCPYLRMDTNARNTRARALYARLGYAEVDVVPTTFNGIEGVKLVCLEKTLK